MNKRFIFVMGFFFVFFIAWNQMGVYLGIIKKVPVEPNQPEQAIEQTVEEKPSLASSEESAEPSEEPQEVEEVVAQETIILQNDKIYLELDNRGAVLRRAKLKNFYLTAKEERNVELLSPSLAYPGEIVLDANTSTQQQVFRVEKKDEQTVVFTSNVAGSSIEKTYRLDGFKLHTSIKDNSGKSFKMIVSDGLQPLVPGDKLTPSFLDFGAINPKVMHVSWSEDGDYEEELPDTDWNSDQYHFMLEENNSIDWIGVSDTYFANVFVPSKPKDNFYVRKNTVILGGEKMILPIVALPATSEISGYFYLGPVLGPELKSADPILENLESFGWAGKLSHALFLALNFIHDKTNNWGWSIIILTFIIRMAMVPLMIPSLKSSFKMRAIQPKIEKLKQKYGNDDLESKQKLSQATFALYKEEGVNPFSACITGIAQMPIFFAYFSLLRESIYLRQADWIWWVNDLSVKDPTYVFPILMGVTMFLSTQAMPMPNADPMQQKMMKIMPVMFSLMFIGMPSGLILYMVTSNIFTLGQNLVMRRRYV